MTALRRPVDLDLVKDALASRIDTLVMQLYPAATRDGAHWRLGSVSGEAGQSLAITRTGANAGLWKDFSSGEAGSALDLIAHAQFAGTVDAEVVRWAVEWCQIGSMDPAEQRRAVERARAAQAKAEASAASARAEKIRRAQALWLGAQPLAGTPAEAYLKGRAIDFAALGRMPNALRYAPECWNAEEQRGVPAMVAFVLDPVTGRQIATHRTYLARDGADRWTKRPGLKDAKKSLGPFGGGHVPIWRGAVDGPLKELPTGTWIATAEGIENAGSIAMQKPDLRCIAHISLDNLGALKLPPNIEGLYVAADNDPPGSPAEAGLLRQLAKLDQRGIGWRLVRAPAGIKDMNDWLKASMRAGA